MGIGRIIFFLGFVPFGKASCAIPSGQGLEVDGEFPDPLPHSAGLLDLWSEALRASCLQGALAGRVPSVFEVGTWAVFGLVLCRYDLDVRVCVKVCSWERESAVCMGAVCVGKRGVGPYRHLSSLLPAGQSLALENRELIRSPFTMGHTEWFMRDSSSALFPSLFLSPPTYRLKPWTAQSLNPWCSSLFWAPSFPGWFHLVSRVYTVLTAGLCSWLPNFTYSLNLPPDFSICFLTIQLVFKCNMSQTRLLIPSSPQNPLLSLPDQSSCIVMSCFSFPRPGTCHPWLPPCQPLKFRTRDTSKPYGLCFQNLLRISPTSLPVPPTSTPVSGAIVCLRDHYIRILMGSLLAHLLLTTLHMAPSAILSLCHSSLQNPPDCFPLIVWEQRSWQDGRGRPFVIWSPFLSDLPSQRLPLPPLQPILALLLFSRALYDLPQSLCECCSLRRLPTGTLHGEALINSDLWWNATSLRRPSWTRLYKMTQ